MTHAPIPIQPAPAAAGLPQPVIYAPLAQQQQRWLPAAAPWLAALTVTLALATTLHAGPRASTSYTVPADSADAGGTHATSSSYRSEGSLGGISGIATVAAPAQTATASAPKAATTYTT